MRLGLDDDVTLGATGSVAMASALLVNRDDRLGPSDILTRGAIKKKYSRGYLKSVKLAEYVQTKVRAVEKG